MRSTIVGVSVPSDAEWLVLLAMVGILVAAALLALFAVRAMNRGRG